MTPRQPADIAWCQFPQRGTPRFVPEALTDKDDRKIDSRLVRVQTRRVFCGSVSPIDPREKERQNHEKTIYL